MLTFRDVLFIALGNALGFVLVSCVKFIMVSHIRVIRINAEDFEEGEEDD